MDGQNEEKNRTDFILNVCQADSSKRTGMNPFLFMHTLTDNFGVEVCVPLGMDFVVPIQMQCLNIDQIKANTLRNRIVCLSFPV